MKIQPVGNSDKFKFKALEAMKKILNNKITLKKITLDTNNY